MAIWFVPGRVPNDADGSASLVGGTVDADVDGAVDGAVDDAAGMLDVPPVVGVTPVVELADVAADVEPAALDSVDPPSSEHDEATIDPTSTTASNGRRMA